MQEAGDGIRTRDPQTGPRNRSVLYQTELHPLTSMSVTGGGYRTLRPQHGALWHPRIGEAGVRRRRYPQPKSLDLPFLSPERGRHQNMNGSADPGLRPGFPQARVTPRSPPRTTPPAGGRALPD